MNRDEQKQMNSEVKISEVEKFDSRVDYFERFNAIVNHIPVMISLFDENGNFEWVNQNWIDELGWDVESMKGRDMLAEFYPDKKTQKEVLDFMISGQSGWKDCYLRKRDGSYIHTSWANVILSNGKGMGIGQNIDHRIRIQTQLLQTSKKISLGEMASGIAHEINNPMTIIYGKINQLLGQIEKGTLTTDQLKDDLKKMCTTSERITNIVKSLRSFSVDSDKELVSEINLKNAIEDSLNICCQQFKNNEIDLILNIDDNLTIHARSSDISQAMLNILRNSFEALALSTNRWVKVEAYRNSKYIVIDITDSGIGISDQIADKVMDPFFTTKEPGKGVGLGLSISQRVIESYNGSLALIKDSPNTKFRIEFPAYE